MKIGTKLKSGGLAGMLFAAVVLTQTAPKNAQAQSKIDGPRAAKDESTQSLWESNVASVSAGIRNFRLTLSLLASSASAAQFEPAGKVVSDKVGLKTGEWFRVDGDKGRIAVVPIASGPVTYEVEFHADQGTAPSQKDYDDSSASYSPAKGLIVRSGNHLGIRVKIGVPAAQAVQVQLETGRIEIGRLTGKIDAKLETGELDYDASALPADVCVNASVNEGSVTNKRDFRCAPGEADLHVHTGTLEVK